MRRRLPSIRARRVPAGVRRLLYAVSGYVAALRPRTGFSAAGFPIVRCLAVLAAGIGLLFARLPGLLFGLPLSLRVGLLGRLLGGLLVAPGTGLGLGLHPGRPGRLRPVLGGNGVVG